MSGRVARHGMASRNGRTSEYMIWQAIKSRCQNKNDDNYNHYGERGITLCARWAQDFQNFLTDMGPKPFPKATVERRDNSRGYGPDNCYWATMTQQARNKRTNVPVIRSDGVRFGTVVEAAESIGVHRSSIDDVCAGRRKSCGGFGWERASTTYPSEAS